jgi:hypothetical protein
MKPVVDLGFTCIAIEGELLERAEQVPEREVRDLLRLPASDDVCEPEVDAKKDSCLHHVVGNGGEAMVRALRLNGLRNRRHHGEGAVVIAKEERRMKALVMLLAPEPAHAVRGSTDANRWGAPMATLAWWNLQLTESGRRRQSSPPTLSPLGDRLSTARHR